MAWLDRLWGWVGMWYGDALYRQERRRLRRRSWAGEVWRVVPPPAFLAGWEPREYLEACETLFGAPTVTPRPRRRG